MTIEEIIELELEYGATVAVTIFSEQPFGDPDPISSSVQITRQIIPEMLGQTVSGTFERISRQGAEEARADMLWIKHAEKSEHGRRESTYYGFEPWMLEKVERAVSNSGGEERTAPSDGEQ